MVPLLATDPLVPDMTLVWGRPPANLVAAPVYMSEAGEVRFEFR